MPELFRLLIADKHPCILKGIENIVKVDSAIAIVGLATSFDQINASCQKYQPDMVLLSLNLLPTPSVEAAVSLQRRYPTTKLLIYADECDTFCFYALLDAGISGYVLKEEPVDEVWIAIQSIAKGGTYFSRPTLAKLKQSEDIPALNPLTEREQEVLQLMGQGMGNQKIAARLSITCRTVKFHTANIYSKLGGLSRTETIAWAWQHEMVNTNRL